MRTSKTWTLGVVKIICKELEHEFYTQADKLNRNHTRLKLTTCQMPREITMLNINSIIPHVGIELDLSPLLHFFRDLVLTFILWQIGYRDFQAAFGIMIASGFFEAGNGVVFQSDGTPSFFDFLDFLPSVLAGFLVVGFLSGKLDFQLLLTLFIIYIAVVLVLLIINLLLGRKVPIKRGKEA